MNLYKYYFFRLGGFFTQATISQFNENNPEVVCKQQKKRCFNYKIILYVLVSQCWGHLLLKLSTLQKIK